VRRKLGPPIAWRQRVIDDGRVETFFYTFAVVDAGPRRGQLLWYCVDNRIRGTAVAVAEVKAAGVVVTLSAPDFHSSDVTDAHVRKVVKSKRLLAQLSDEVREAIAARVMLMEET